jgi:hypothetical protein
MAQVTGEKGDLGLLSKIFTEGPAAFRLIRDEFWLGGSFLDGLACSMDVIEKARDRLELMLGAARIESGNDGLSASLSGICRSQDEHGIVTTVTLLPPAGISIGSSVTLWFHEPGASRAYVQAAEGDKHLDLAVRLWSDSSRTWPRLYRIVEEIYVSFRSEGDKYASEVLFGSGLVDSKERYLRFANSTNEAQCAGKDSRHAMDNNKTPKEARRLDNPYLTHAEAVSFVRECLKRALERRSNPSSSS